jgi:hypothetical protein
MRLNCWQAKKCGREPGGVKVAEMGVCPAVTACELNALNHGKNGGRMCWAVAGTFCGGKVQGSFAEKRMSCLSCEFYMQVKQDEAKTFTLMPPGKKYAVESAGA